MLTLLMMLLSLIESSSMEFSNFVRMYNKSYVGSSDEVELRRMHYERNLERIAELNRRHGATTRFGVNEFSDLSFEEFSEQKLGSYISSPSSSEDSIKLKTTVLEAASVDWRNVTTPVRDQVRGVRAKRENFNHIPQISLYHHARTQIHWTM